MNTSTHFLDPKLEGLAALTRASLPVISLYLDTRPDQHGRDHYEPFVRKCESQVSSLSGPHSDAFNEITDRIRDYLRNEVEPSANGVALFARPRDSEFFEAIQCDAPIDNGHLVISHQPYLFPLARLRDQYSRYAALIADTHSARLYVFELGKALETAGVESPKLSRTQTGGWSQSRYQRHVDNVQLHHGKDVVEALDQLVRETHVAKIVLAGEKVILPEIRNHLPAPLAGKVIEVTGLDMHTSEDEIRRITSDKVHEEDAREDETEVARIFDEQGSGGLGALGAEETLVALDQGQVDELFLVASPAELQANHDGGQEWLAQIETSITEKPEAWEQWQAALANELVTRALKTRARIRFIENPSLLAPVGGVGARLRYTVAAPQPTTQGGQR